MERREKYLLGPQIRRLRRERGLTQAQMAAELGVSASYVNLIERNQRTASANILVRLARAYGVDVAALDGTDEANLLARLTEAFADPVLRGAGVTREDAVELATGNPVLGEAVATLFGAWRTTQNTLMETRAGGRAAIEDPVEEARGFLHANRNHFAAIDAWGEEAAAVMSGAYNLFSALAARFEERHGLRVRVLPQSVMAGAIRRHNVHAKEIAISERLDHASRTFNLALQLCLLEAGGLLDRTANAGRFETDAGRRLARAALGNYAAAAIMMPYEKFRIAAEEFRYDIEALGRRFGASFEQVAHRLTTLQRPNAEGVAFFFLRVDAAGNISKRYTGDIFPFATYGGSCPLWNIHETFRTPRRILTQILQLPDGSRFFSISRTVYGGEGGFDAPQAERAVALGCRLVDAPRLVYAAGMDPDMVAPTPIGATCRLCDRVECRARAHPPLKRRLVTDEYWRIAAPFSFAFD